MDVDIVDLDADIEIDPDLFIKCRLCIEEIGSLHIHQSLQAQIKFCFDINVQDFDYLSKLLCKKCRTILEDFATVKKKFLANQTILLDKVKSKENTREGNQTKAECNHIKGKHKENADEESADHVKETRKEEFKTTKNTKKRIKRDSLFISSDDEDNISHGQYVRRSSKRRKTKILRSTESSCENELELVAKEKETIDDDKQLSWDQCYQKLYICRFCDYKDYTKEGIIMHGKIHSKLMDSYKILKRHCTIRMEKIDDRPNVTGDVVNVVLSLDNIVSGANNISYYVKYILPEQCCESNQISTLKNIACDSSKGVVTKYRNRNETVVLEGSKIPISDGDSNTNNSVKKTKTVSVSSDIPCIDILDTSSNDSTVQLKDKHITKNDALKIIKDVSTDCFKNYRAGYNNVSQKNAKKKKLNKILQTKLLRVKKMMPTNVPRGSKTPDLLTYLQYKNARINWIPVCKNFSCRIVSEMTPQNTNENFTGWYAIKNNVDFEVRERIPDDFQCDQIPEKPNDLHKTIENKELQTNIYEPDINNVVDTNAASANATSENSSTTVIPVENKNIRPAVSHQIVDINLEQGNKLLNTNPVANPKQLQKIKFVPIYEEKESVDLNGPSKTTVIVKDSLLKNILSQGSPLVRQNQQSELPMPIITSTTSLAEKFKTTPMRQNSIEISNKTEALSDQSNETEISIPRIKCKPVSELMPQSIQPVQEVASVSLDSVISKMKPIPSGQVSSFTANAQRDTRKVTVNSVHLRNSSSISPIEYFKIVLKMHGLELITQVNYVLTHDFVCLVKFKAVFPDKITIWLYLFAHKSTFCFKLKNLTGEMDLDLLPPAWQMKILQVYCEVSENVLQYSKTLNERIHSNAKQFVVLLKNIKFTITTV